MSETVGTIGLKKVQNKRDAVPTQVCRPGFSAHPEGWPKTRRTRMNGCHHIDAKGVFVKENVTYGCDNASKEGKAIVE